MDQIDRSILRILQQDVSISMEALAHQVALSKNACWRRVRQLESAGIISRKVALVNPKAVGLGQAVIVAVKVKEHSPQWLAEFKAAIEALPEVTGAFRTGGDVDYILSVRVSDVEGYDRFYKALIAMVPGADISATFVMEEIKNTTALPL